MTCSSRSRRHEAFYVGFGIAAGLFLLFLLLRSLRKSELLVADGLLAVFLGAHVLLVFTDIFPYQIYSRYMLDVRTGPDLAPGGRSRGLRERPRFVLVFALLVLFIPAVILKRRLVQEQDRVLGAGPAVPAP